MAGEEPHWSVLTDPRFKAATIEDRKIEFYDTGAAPVEYFAAAARRAGERLADKSTCFELGCGVGRVTTHLASKFRHVIASDISDDHLRIAREHLSSAGLTNVSYFQLRDVGSIRSAPPFDALFTVIVLQHNPPPIIAFLLRELLAKLSPGGLGYFQVPTYLTNYTFEVDTYLRSQDMPQMELHALSQRDTFDIIAAAACRVLDIREDSWMGDMGGISNSFLVKKTCQ